MNGHPDIAALDGTDRYRRRLDAAAAARLINDAEVFALAQPRRRSHVAVALGRLTHVVHSRSRRSATAAAAAPMPTS
jgi:hypothetical protein